MNFWKPLREVFIHYLRAAVSKYKLKQGSKILVSFLTTSATNLKSCINKMRALAKVLRFSITHSHLKNKALFFMIIKNWSVVVSEYTPTLTCLKMQALIMIYYSFISCVGIGLTLNVKRFTRYLKKNYTFFNNIFRK